MKRKRTISYTQKAKLQRMKLYILLAAVLLIAVFSLAPYADNGISEKRVMAEKGDSLWSLCEMYKPEDMDLRLFIDKVKYVNRLQSSTLSIGQELIMPLR